MSSSNALFTMRAFTREDDVILLKSGEVLFRPGETGTTMFGLLEGGDSHHLDWTSWPEWS